MRASSLEGKRVVFFHGDIYAPGGSERLMVEEIKYFEKNGAKTHIITYNFNREALFSEAFKADIHELIGKSLIYSTPLPLRVMYLPRMVLALRRKLKEIKPDIIISRTEFECLYLYLATLFTPFSYVTHLHETISRSPGDLRFYALIYRKAMRKIRETTPGHKEFTPKVPPKANPLKRIIGELTAFVEYLAVRKAKKIFVLSNQIKWEVEELYHKEAVVVRGAFASEILNYEPRRNIKEKLGLKDKRIVLNVNRLEPRKRVGLLIKAFKELGDKFQDLALVIGGTGTEENNLKSLVRELVIEDRVKFVGFIPQEQLWDYYASCDVFVHPDWAHSVIIPFEVLALQKKVVWSTEVEVDEYLSKNKHIFRSDPTVGDLAKTMEKALTTDVKEKFDMSPYTWDKYIQQLVANLSDLM